MKKEITVQGVYLINQGLKVAKFLKLCKKDPKNIIFDYCLHNAIDDYIAMCRDALTLAFVQQQSRLGKLDEEVEKMVNDGTFDIWAVEFVTEMCK